MIWWCVLLMFLVMLPANAVAQGVGIFTRPACTTLTSPVAGQTECLDTTRGVWLNYDGTGWQSDVARATNVRNVMDSRWGAKGDGATDDTAAIQSALTGATSGTVIFFPPTLGSNFYRITTCLNLPLVNGVTLAGAGRRVSRIRQVTAATDAICSNNVWATATNGIEIRDLWIEGTNAARYGLNWAATNRSTIRNVRLAGFTGGAGIFTLDSLLLTIDNVGFDGNKDGLFDDGTSLNTNANGWRIINSTFENQTQYAINVFYFFALHFSGNTLQSNALGGMRIVNGGGAIAIVNGNYFEENLTISGGGTYFDVYIGTAAPAFGNVLEGNYFNGRTAGTTDDYYPVRVGISARGWRVQYNFVNVGNRFLRFDGTVADSLFGPQVPSVAFDDSVATTVYNNLPSTFHSTRNNLFDFRAFTAQTFTAQSTDFTVTQTGTAYYSQVYRIVTVLIPDLQGTSNATTFTITGLPSDLWPARQHRFVVITQDNSAALASALGQVDTNGDIKVFKDPAGTAFTASGTKRVLGMTFTYQLQ